MNSADLIRKIDAAGFDVRSKRASGGVAVVWPFVERGKEVPFTAPELDQIRNLCGAGYELVARDRGAYEIVEVAS